MSNRGESRGIYADLAATRAAKYDPELEKRVHAWIEAVTGKQLRPTFRESLMDGQVVCELFNKLYPGSIPKIHNSTVLMFRRENWGFFQNACVKLGLSDSETAVFEDVYEDRNMGQFLTNIVGLARKAQYRPEYKGPILADASKEAVAAAAPSAPQKYIGTLQEEAARKAEEAKDSARYVEHGILVNPEVHVHHGQKDAGPAKAPAAGGKYIPTAQEVAAKKVQDQQEAGRYREHGIIVDPSSNTYHGQKDSSPAASAAPAGKYIPTAQELAAKKAQDAQEAGRYREHGILMNPSDNRQAGGKS
jgi:hypothetical protein